MLQLRLRGLLRTGCTDSADCKATGRGTELRGSAALSKTFRCAVVVKARLTWEVVMEWYGPCLQMAQTSRGQGGHNEPAAGMEAEPVDFLVNLGGETGRECATESRGAVADSDHAAVNRCAMVGSLTMMGGVADSDRRALADRYAMVGSQTTKNGVADSDCRVSVNRCVMVGNQLAIGGVEAIIDYAGLQSNENLLVKAFVRSKLPVADEIVRELANHLEPSRSAHG